MRFTSLFVLAAAVVSSLATTVATVEADIANISSQVTSLDNAINSFPNTGGTLAQALAIHTAATKLDSTLKSATTDVNGVSPKPVSESDGQTILASVTAFVPTIEDALIKIVQKKPAFDALPLGGVSALVKQDLANLRADTYAFATALIGAAPSDLVATATALRTQIDNDFAVAQAGYP